MRGAFLSTLLLAGACASFLRADDALAVADRLARLHLVYLYGSDDLGKGGLDCSGFTQTVFRESNGLNLPDEADQQLAYCREHGQVWDSASGWTPATLQPGDLIFFAGPDPSPRTSLVTHVMIYCGGGLMAGAQGKGRQIDGTLAGVGYYPFGLHYPQGILGESGERFIGHRRVFAYGRLLPVPVSTAHPSGLVAATVPLPLD